jgi:Na+/phosphate symporter
MKNKGIHLFIISTFVLLYLVVSVISTIHVVDFFQITNPKWLSIFLAIAFEIGAAASLASIIVLDKMNKFIVWSLFFVLTAMQAIGNTYFAYTHLSDFTAWSELFGLSEEDLIFQKRVLAVISGAILPLVSLGFIKALVDYIRPGSDIEEEKGETNFIEEDKEENTIQIEEDKEEIKNDIESPRKLKDTIYYDLDPTKIT